ANPLPVPWFDQLRMDDGQGWRDCFSASSAMLAAFWGREPDENTYNHLREHYGDSTSSEAQLAALRHLGLQADFGTDGDLQVLKREIDAGRPVAVGWLHHGTPEAPSGGGHWTVVIGYDDSGVIMNDPYGSCDLVNGGYPANHNGARQHYSYRNWLPRWQPQNSGGWYLCCRPPA
ncbi:MAG: Synechococcus phage, partial [Cyanobacteriota bacterium]